jgi:hypothetical protein
MELPNPRGISAGNIGKLYRVGRRRVPAPSSPRFERGSEMQNRPVSAPAIFAQLRLIRVPRASRSSTRICKDAFSEQALSH